MTKLTTAESRRCGAGMRGPSLVCLPTPKKLLKPAPPPWAGVLAHIPLHPCIQVDCLPRPLPIALPLCTDVAIGPDRVLVLSLGLDLRCLVLVAFDGGPLCFHLCNDGGDVPLQLAQLARVHSTSLPLPGTAQAGNHLPDDVNIPAGCTYVFVQKVCSGAQGAARWCAAGGAQESTSNPLLQVANADANADTGLKSSPLPPHVRAVAAVLLSDLRRHVLGCPGRHK